MRFVVLGTVGVTDGGEIDIGTGRQRRLLAVLLARRDRSVSIAELADLVWADADGLPDHPDRSLRTYVSRLRASLQTDASVIETTDDGYRLRLGVHELDADELERLVADASAALRDGRTDVAAAAIDRALALWRGRPFGGLGDELWARAETERLEELFAIAQEHRLEVLASREAHREIVVAATRLVADHPLRESFRRHLIVALHRSGRTPEALRAYQEYRGWLATEVGLDPSPEMQELERRLLAGDNLAVASPGAPPAGRVRTYELVERIGEGAFAVVYRGTQPSVGREVAIKQIRQELANHPEFVRRFEAEAHMVARLEHPHIVPLYDYWREPGSAYLVMRWLRGGTLEQRLFESSLSLDEARTMVAHIGAALAAAHRAGIVHRDVKPANILLDGEGNFFLGDFGIALAAEESADPASALSAGSPAYAAPEQLRREPVGPAADVHGLAIATFEALAGRLPFPDERTHAGLLQRQLHDPVPSLHALRPELPTTIDAVIARATAKDPAARHERVDALVADFLAALEGVAAPVRRSGTGTIVSGLDERNPYKGLLAFDEADAADFFGRERLVDRLVAQLGSTTTAGRLLAVVGPSGSGKSSVVHAGLVPALRRGRVTGSGEWYVTTMVPGNDPFGELDAALARVATTPVPDSATTMRADPKGIGRAVRRSLPAGRQLLLVIDQFEELFTLVDDEPTRQRFIESLVGALVDPHAQLRVVLTLRADFWDRPLRYASLARLLDGSAVPVLPLAPDELEHAIVAPAHAGGADLEPGLLATIVADVADQPGALPLLQYALTELWERAVSGLLTRDAYHRLGGIVGALARRADEAYEAGDDRQRAATRRVFTRLVTLGEGTEDTRRRVRLSELGDDEAVAAVITRFGAARLLSFDRDPASREPTVEVAHEALIRVWRRLRDWLDEDRDGLRAHGQVTASATAWDRDGRPADALLRGVRLAGTLERLGDRADYNQTELDFLDASANREQAEADARMRTQRRFHRLFVGVSIALAVAIGSTVFALAQRADARRTRDASEIGRLVAQSQALRDGDLAVALLLALEAHRRAPTSLDTRGALQGALAHSPHLAGFFASEGDGLTPPSVSPDGTQFVVGDQSGGALVWDLASRRIVGRLDTGDGRPTPTWSPTGDRIAVVTGHKDATMTIGFWDAHTYRRLGEPVSVPGLAEWNPPAFSPDGTRLVVPTSDGRVDVFDAASGRLAVHREFDGAALGTAAFDGRGRLYVAERELAPAPELRVLDAATLADVTEMAGTSNGGWSVAVSPDGSIVALGRGDGTISVIDTATFEVRRRLVRHRTQVHNLSFTADGARLASTAQDGTAIVWDVTTGDVAVGPFGNPADSSFVAISQDGGHLVQTGIGGRGVVWDLTARQPLARPWGPSDAYYGSASPDGQLVATTSLSGVVRLVDAGSGAELGHIEAAFAAQASFSPDGKQLAFWTTGGLQVVDVPSLRPVGPPIAVPAKPFPEDFPMAVVWSPDGGRIAIGFFKGRLALVDPVAGRLLGDPPTVSNMVATISFSPDGRRVGLLGGLIESRLYDTTTGQPVGGVVCTNACTLAFSPTGRLLAALSEVQVLDAATLRVIGTSGEVMRQGIYSAAFRSDGRRAMFTVNGAWRLVDVDGDRLTPIGDTFTSETGRGFTASGFLADGSVLFPGPGDAGLLRFDLDEAHWATTACEIVGRNLTLVEWNRYVGGSYHAACSQFPSGQ